MVASPVLDADGVLDVALLPSQLVAIVCEAEWAAFYGGKGSGKTVGLCFWMLQRLEEYPLATHFVVGADYEQLRRGFFQSFIDALASIGWEEGTDFRYRDSPSPMIMLPSGARLRSLSSTLAARIESVQIQTLLLEEPQTWKNGESIYVLLNTRLRHSQRSATLYGDTMPLRGRMSFNPPRQGTWLHRLVMEQWPGFGYPAHRVSVRDNYLLQDRDGYVRRLERALPPHLWPSQIDGFWEAAGGGALHEYVREIHGLLREDASPLIPRGTDANKPLVWSLDFNVAHMRSVIAQAHEQRIYTDGFTYHRDRSPQQRYRLEVPGWQRRILRFVAEIALDNTGSRQVAEEFVRRFGDHARRTGVILVGDSTGGSRSQIDGTTTNWNTITDTLDRHQIPYSYQVKTNGSVYESIVLLDAQLRNGDGFGATIDIAACTELTLDVETCNMDKAGTGLDKSDKSPAGQRRTHAFDAARYAVVWFQGYFAARDANERKRDRQPTLSR